LHFPATELRDMLQVSTPQIVVGRILGPLALEALISPITGKRCVHYELAIEELNVIPRTTTQFEKLYWSNCLKTHKSIDFVLVDPRTTKVLRIIAENRQIKIYKPIEGCPCEHTVTLPLAINAINFEEYDRIKVRVKLNKKVKLVAFFFQGHIRASTNRHARSLRARKVIRMQRNVSVPK